MAANKENFRSRIPVKVEVKKEDDNRREPLSTIANQNQNNSERDDSKNPKLENLAGPSNKTLDTKFVTTRNQNEELDWTFDVFKDSTSKGTKSFRKETTKQKGDSHNDMEQLLNTATTEAVNKSGSRLDPAITEMYVVTPEILFKNPSDYVLRKVKKSVQKPQNASAQDTSYPVTVMPHQCTKPSENKIRKPVSDVYSSIDDLNRVYVMDNLSHLLKTEKKSMSAPMVRSASRTCVINWITNINGTSGSPLVIHLACWYLDCYLASTLVAVTRLQVIAAACFWIAAKFHGSSISARRLVKYSGNAFSKEELITTERSMLRKLKFPSVSVTSYDVIPYLSWCCDQSCSGVVEAAAVFLCQCGLLTNKFFHHEYPSVIAAAAVKSAVILLRQNVWLEELKKNPIYKAAITKARNLNGLCAELREAVRVVSAPGYEYKAPLLKYAAPPFYIATKIVRAVNYSDIAVIDGK